MLARYSLLVWIENLVEQARECQKQIPRDTCPSVKVLLLTFISLRNILKTAFERVYHDIDI